MYFTSADRKREKKQGSQVAYLSVRTLPVFLSAFVAEGRPHGLSASVSSPVK